MIWIAVYCENDDEIRLVARIVPAGGEPAESIIEQLLLGVTPIEAQVGLRSSFSSYTAGQFNSVQLDPDGVATVDLTTGFVRTNNFSTSNGSMQVFTQLTESLFTLPEVTGVEFAVAGERWCGWEAGPCDDYARPLIRRRE